MAQESNQQIMRYTTAAGGIAEPSGLILVHTTGIGMLAGRFIFPLPGKKDSFL